MVSKGGGGKGQRVQLELTIHNRGAGQRPPYMFGDPLAPTVDLILREETSEHTHTHTYNMALRDLHFFCLRTPGYIDLNGWAEGWAVYVQPKRLMPGTEKKQ